MRFGFALRALPLLLFAGPLLADGAAAQTREQIREQNQQLYQQYQQGSGDNGGAVAPPLGGNDAAASASAPDTDTAAAPAGGGGGNLLTQLLDRVSRLEEQNRTLAGRVDELGRELQTSTAALNKQIGDLSFAMQQGHGAAAAPVAAAAPAVAPVPAAPPHPSRRSAPDERAPETPAPGARGAGAVYRQAGAYAASGNWREAALTYYDSYNRDPHGPLAPSALLHVSSSMIALGQNGAACEALGKLGSEFPRARGNIPHSAAVLRARAHC